MKKEIKLEILSILKNKFSLFIVSVPMLVIALTMHFTLSKEVITKIPIGVLDLDQTTTSRDVIFNIQASQGFLIKQHYLEESNAQKDLSSGKIFALVVLPSGMQKNYKKSTQSTIPIYYNAQFLLVGKNIQSKFSQIFGTLNVKFKMARNLVENKTIVGAKSKSIPILEQITSLYNPDSSYYRFLITTILPCSWQILILVGMINSLTLLKDPKNIYTTLYAKIIVNTAIFMGWWVLMMIYFTTIVKAPMNGSWWVMSLGAVATTMAYNSIGIFIYALSKEPTRAISVASVYSAPSFAFAGVTFPINSMNAFAKFWSSFLPITHYLSLYVNQANYGGNIGYALQTIFSIVPFMLFGVIGIMLYGMKK